MKGSLSQILIGSIFIFLAIRVGVDLLADPIGYFLIAAGCYKLGEVFKDGRVAAYIAMGMIFFSMPSVMIDFNLVDSGPWYYYSNFLFAAELVLVFYLFRMLKEIAVKGGDNALEGRTRRLFNIYIPANLLMLGLGAVMAVYYSDSLQILAFILVIALLVLNIAFLLLLNAFRKSVKEDKPAMISIEEAERGNIL